MTQSEMDADLFKVKLMNRLRISELQLDTFSSLLTEYGAIIAGGSLLSAYSGPDQRINDLDIYVNLTNAQNFIYKFTFFSIEQNTIYFRLGNYIRWNS